MQNMKMKSLCSLSIFLVGASVFQAHSTPRAHDTLQPPLAKPMLSRIKGETNGQANAIPFEVTVDGSDDIHIQGNTVWIAHLAWLVPEPIRIDGTYVYFDWKDNVSDKWHGLKHPLPGAGTITPSIAIDQAGGPITLKQAPTADNGYEAIINLDDTQPPGAHPFVFTLSWTASDK